jgi:octaprenyl-diphosphate synthase
MDNLKLIKKPVKEELAEFEKHFKKKIVSDIPFLNIITNYILRHKGKQIRPLLVFLSSKLVGEINKSTYSAATLIEFLHTATLLHDDVVDESYERRNHFSINAIWKSKVAVLLGDYFLSSGLLLSIANNEYKLLETVSESVKEMSEGELIQIQSSKKALIDIDNYFKIIKKKTASLFASCTLCGAQSSTDNPVLLQKLKEYGLNIGIAFQIKDDLFDYQHKGLIGKPTGNDIKDKKFTLPLILALKNAPENESRTIIKKINTTDFSKFKYNEIVQFVDKNNGLIETEKYLNEYKNRAIEILSYFPDNETKQSMSLFAEFIINRNK